MLGPDCCRHKHGRSKIIPDVRVAERGGPTSPPLFWLMALGLSCVKEERCSSPRWGSYADSEKGSVKKLMWCQESELIKFDQTQLHVRLYFAVFPYAVQLNVSFSELVVGFKISDTEVAKLYECHGNTRRPTNANDSGVKSSFNTLRLTWLFTFANILAASNNHN